MFPKLRVDRRVIHLEAFRANIAALYGPRPNFAWAEKELGVNKSTLNRVWLGRTSTVSAANLKRLTRTILNAKRRHIRLLEQTGVAFSSCGFI